MNYAIIDADLNVINVIVWDGNSETWSPPEGYTVLAVPDSVPVSIGYTFVDGEFVAPPPPELTPEEALALNTRTRDALQANAAVSIAPLQDADDLGIATAEEAALLKQWKQFRVALNRLDLTQATIAWPAPPTA